LGKSPPSGQGVKKAAEPEWGPLGGKESSQQVQKKKTKGVHFLQQQSLVQTGPATRGKDGPVVKNGGKNRSHAPCFNKRQTWRGLCPQKGVGIWGKRPAEMTRGFVQREKSAPLGTKGWGVKKKPPAPYQLSPWKTGWGFAKGGRQPTQKNLKVNPGTERESNFPRG